MTAEDRTMLVKLLEDTRDRFENAVSSVPADHWQTRPAPESWSPSETAEHLILTELAIGAAVRTKLPDTPAVDPAPDPQKFDTILLERIPDRSPDRRRQQSPDWLRPSGKYGTPADAIRAFSSARAKTIEFVSTTEHPLRCHKMEHPAFGPIDGCQWIIFLGAHTERHVRQLEDALQAQTQIG